MTKKIKQLLIFIGFLFIITSFSSCNLLRSPISMVKKFGVWQLADDDRWRDYFYSNPTYEKIIKEYQYFEKYKSSNWSKQKLGQWFLHSVYYSTKFNEKVPDEKLGSFVFVNKKEILFDEIINYLKKGLRFHEKKTYAGYNVIYTTKDMERINEIIELLGSGDVTDISFSNSIALLRWITNKLGDSDYGEDVIFLGTYIITDLKIIKNDGTENVYEYFGFYTTPDDPISPYRNDRPYSFY